MIIDEEQIGMKDKTIGMKDQTIGNLNLRLDGITYDKNLLTNQVKSFK